jgi:hypothetical protein
MKHQWIVLLAALVVLAGCKKNGKPSETAADQDVTHCQAYMSCCLDYVDAMSQVGGMDPAMSAATEQACHDLEPVLTLDTAQESCLEAMAAMVHGIEGLQIPGMDKPGSCEYEPLAQVDPSTVGAILEEWDDTSCEDFLACCDAYTAELARVSFAPEEVEEMRQACDEVREVQHAPDAPEACAEGLVEMKNLMPAMEAQYEGFAAPAACQ